MSFGLDKPFDDDLDTELRDVQEKIRQKVVNAHNKIFFAAAGNRGCNNPRSFPGAFSQVICVHASNGYGKDGGISPNAKSTDDNFMTLGMNIVFGAPTNTRSGTSFATPIAAGIAANILQIANTMGLSPDHSSLLRTGGGMQTMFRCMSYRDAENYRFVAPWTKLWPPGWHLHDERIAAIRKEIKEALDN